MQSIFNLTEAAGKPLIVDEFNLQRPIAQRNEGLQLIYGLLMNTTAPVAGELLTPALFNFPTRQNDMQNID